MQKKVAIINYGMGNLQSVLNAFYFLNIPVAIAETVTDLQEASHIVLPGVGAFGDGMKNLKARGWISPLQTEVKEKKKPFLGICLGMQLLATMGTEYGQHEGLNFVAGTVDRMPAKEPEVRIPHIGWNEVDFLKKDGLYAGVEKNTFYFVHSFAFHPKNVDVVSGICHHGEKFAASIEQENILATQFHPEKSQKAGLILLKNFANKKYA